MKCWTTIVAGVAAVLLNVSALCAQATAPATEPATAPAAVAPPAAVAVLNMLQQRDQTLKDFTADIKYAVYHPRTADTFVQIGDASYLKTDDGTKFGAHFKREGASGSLQSVDKTLIFDGRWIIQSDAMAKVYQKTEIVPPGSKVKPLKLGEGAFPIPIGQDTEKVLRDFNVTVEAVDPKLPDAADLTHLKLVPKNDDLAKSYDMDNLELWVNGKLELPIQLVRDGKDGNTTTITLKNVNINAGAPKIFDLPEPKESDGWVIRVDSKPEQGPETQK